MRTRLASVATALLWATTAFAGTAGTALMATVTNQFGGAANGAVLCEYSYDSASDVMTAIVLINNDTVSHLVVGEALDTTTFAVVASGSQQMAPNTTKSFNISPLNLKMVTVVGKGGVLDLQPPYILACGVK